MNYINFFQNNTLLKNSSWSLLGTICSKGFFFLAWMFVANQLTVQQNGEIGIVRSTLALFIVFIGNGIGLTATRYISEFYKKDSIKTENILNYSLSFLFTASFIISILMYFLSEWIAVEILKTPSLIKSVKISSFLLLVNILLGGFMTIFQGFERYKTFGLLQIAQGFFTFLFIVIFTLNKKIEQIFLGYLIGSFFSLIFCAYYIVKIYKEYDFRLKFIFKKEIQLFKKFTLPAILSGIMVVPFKWILDRELVVSEGGLEYMGIFSALILINNVLIIISNSINAPLITLMSTDKSSKVQSINILLPWILALIMGVPLILFPNLFKLLLNDNYVEHPLFLKTFIIIISYTILIIFKQGLSRVLIISNQMWFGFLGNLIWGVVLIASFFYVENKNSYTLSLSYLLAYVVDILITIPFYLYKKIIPITLLLSFESIVIWIITFSLILYALNYNTFDNIIILFLSLGFYFYLLYRLFKKSRNEKI